MSPPYIARICLILSEPADRDLLAGFLQQTGYQVEIVNASALDAGGCNPLASSSLAIVDHATACRHGARLLTLKAQVQPQYLPILLALAGNRRSIPWLRGGFDDVLRLPLSKDDLLARLEAFLRLRQHSEDVVREGDRHYRGMFDLAPVGIVHTTLNGQISLVNPRFCEMLLHAKAEVTGRTLLELAGDQDSTLMQQAVAALLVGDGGMTAPFDQRYRRSDGQLIWTIVKVSVARDASGRPKHLIAAIEDISERKAMEQSLRESERFVKSTIDALSEHICVVDEKGNILTVNKAWREYSDNIGAPTTHDWIGVNYLDICDKATATGPRDAAAFAEGMRDVLFGRREEFTLEYPCSSPTAERWYLAKVTRFQLDGPVRVVISHENVTQAKLAQQHLMFLAHYDNLTGLPNRVLFYDRLKHTLLQAERSDWTVAVMFIDLDNFKLVNDTMGHAAGDQLLKQASARIVAGLRANDTVGRLGGDEFGVFLPDLLSANDAGLVAQKIMDAMACSFMIDNKEHFVTCSIGITVYPDDARDSDGLVSNADTAMYRAKQLGRNNHQYFTAHMNAHMIEHARLENGLRLALERQELFLEYQPQVDMQSGRIVGVEALMRWRHPELGMVAPTTFIPIAEETGLIVAIGEWALGVACTQNVAWQKSGLTPLVMAVNLSARQFKHKDMSDTVRQVLHETGLNGNWLELELTEGIVMENAEALIATMNRLKTFGVRLSLDDFGTGYSNLGYLKRFPLDAIKIDRSFVSGIGDDFGADESMIASTVITLGHSLRLAVIAEGVETSEQLRTLKALKCDIMQGFLFSVPLSASAMTKLLEDQLPPQLSQ